MLTFWTDFARGKAKLANESRKVGDRWRGRAGIEGKGEVMGR